ncbi:MAG: MBL fold metallo-hydrolase [Caldilineaceae bacterium]
MSHSNNLILVENQGWDQRILVCRNDELVDTFIVVTAQYVVLIDTVINPATAAKMVEYAQPYVTGGRALLVVNTHADYDHAWGNQLFAGPEARYPAPIIATLLCAEQFGTPEVAESLAQRQEKEPAIFGEIKLTPPTLLFDETLTIQGGDLTLELFATPGHTVDHLSIYIPEIRTLLAADAAELPYPLARTVDGLPAMRTSLAKMAALETDFVLYCHAPVTIGGQLLRDNMAYFDALEAHCQRWLDQGPVAIADDDATLITQVGCPYDAMVPQDGAWAQVHPYYRVQGHAVQIRMMLEHLQKS